MGNRANIHIVEDDGGDLFFYTHWSGYRLQSVLAEALDRGRGRWGDEPYLSRIIFSEMIKDDVLEETGFGITTYRTDFEYDDIVVHMKSLSVTDRDGQTLPFADFVSKHKATARP